MKQILCDACIHKNVCCNKELFKQAQEVVNNVVLTDGDLVVRLSDIDWIEPAMLYCVNSNSGTVNRFKDR